MKKLGFCLMALCLVSYTVGCGKEDTTPPPAEPAPPADTGNDTEPADPAVDEEGAAN